MVLVVDFFSHAFYVSEAFNCDMVARKQAGDTTSQPRRLLTAANLLFFVAPLEEVKSATTSHRYQFQVQTEPRIFGG